MNYRKIWESYYGTIPENFEIHHIDGNRNNNDISNLKCVSIEEHFNIHLNQNDFGAALAISIRMNSDKEIIQKLASKFQKELLLANDHNFQKISKEKRSNISKNTIKKRIDSNLPAFLNIKNTKENAKNAGKIASEKHSGFLDTKSIKHGSKYVKNTYWWINNITGERMRSKNSPGIEWKRGMK